MTLSADARTALRRAITNHPRWDEYRRAHNLSLATMSKDQFMTAAEDLQIDVDAIRRDVAASPAPTIVPIGAPGHVNDGLDASQFPARGASTARGARAADDFADDAPEAPDAPEFDMTDIPAIPVPVSPAVLAKLDSIIAIAVDPDISFSALYQVAKRATMCASALKTELETGGSRRDPHAHVVKSSLDFVAPSWSREFLDYLDIGATVAVVGPAGNGKTTGAKKLLQRAGFNVYEFDCTDATLPQDLIGRTALRQEGGATVTDWTPGPVALAFADPKGAVLLNEYDALDPRTGMALQSALEAADTRRVTAPDTGTQITSKGSCPIVLTLNTIGHGATVEYQGRNALDGANRDRVEMVVTGYESEAEIMVAHGFHRETADRLATWAGAIRLKLKDIGSREILSNRRLLTAAALMDRRGMSADEAMTRAFFGRMNPNEFQRYEAAR